MGQSELQLTRAGLWAGQGAGRVPGCPRSPGQGIFQQWLQFSGRLGRGCQRPIVPSPGLPPHACAWEGPGVGAAAGAVLEAAEQAADKI